MLNQKLQLKLSQKLSPQQIQLMKLIQLSTLEFEQRLSREIEENPALDTVNDNNEIEKDEFDFEENNEKQESSDDEIDISDYLTDDDIPEYNLSLGSRIKIVKSLLGIFFRFKFFKMSSYTGLPSLVSFLENSNLLL